MLRSPAPFGTPILTRIPVKFRTIRHIQVRRRDPPPGRKRKLKCSQKKKLNHIQISTSTNPDVIQFRMEKLENLNRSPRAIGLRNSKAWFTKLTAPLTRVELPLIDHLGRYTGCNIYYTGCMRPDSYVSTVISTIFQRLMNYSRKHNGLRETRIRQSILLRVAAYYGLTRLCGSSFENS